ncbi:cytochrome P450 [Hymenopellis radicata]|nr:cytochrome P450 [Hymenopellis radicata]
MLSFREIDKRLAVQANLNEKTGKGLTKEEMLSSMQTVMGAGHETTANSLSWTLYELAKHPEVARGNLGGRKGARSADDQSSGILIDAVQEILRLHPVSYYGNREVAKDDVLPLSKRTTTDGRTIQEVAVPKGTSVYISLAEYNGE